MLLAAAVALTTTFALPERARADGVRADRIAILVYDDDLGSSAAGWAAYRMLTGWTVRPIAVEDGASAEAVRERIWSEIADATGGDDRPRRSDDSDIAVVLFGDATSTGVPTFHRPQPDPILRRGPDEEVFATDWIYCEPLDADAPSSVRPSLGRLPVREARSAQDLLVKIGRYEQASPKGAWLRRATYVAGEGRFGPFDRLLETLFRAFVEELLPLEVDLTMTYAKADSPWCPPPESLGEVVLSRLSEGALLFNYVGHGHARGLDRLHWTDEAGRAHRTRMLEVEDLDRLEPAAAGAPIALLSCCSTGWIDRKDGAPSLAEALLLHPHGPIAVLAGTRPTHPYGNALVQKEFTTTLFAAEAGATLGLVDRRARRALDRVDATDRRLDLIAEGVALVTRWPLSLAELRTMHRRMYVLCGDPCLAIPVPSASIEASAVRDAGRISIAGRVHGLPPGAQAEVVVRLETRRDEWAAGDGRDRSGQPFPALARELYPLVNERVLAQASVAVVDGVFEHTFDRPDDRGAVVRIELRGRQSGTAALVLEDATPENDAAVPGGTTERRR